MDLNSWPLTENSGTLPLDLLFLKLPFAVWPGLTDSRVSKSLGIRNGSIVYFNSIVFKL